MRHSNKSPRERPAKARTRLREYDCIAECGERHVVIAGNAALARDQYRDLFGKDPKQIVDKGLWIWS